MKKSKPLTVTEKARQGVIDSAAELPAVAHIKMAQALDGATKALRILRATAKDLNPNTKLAARVDDDLEPLLRHDGKLDTLRAYLDSGLNKAVTDEQFNALGGLPGLYYTDGWNTIPTRNEYPAELDRPDDRALFRNGFPDLLRQIERGGDLSAAGEGLVPMVPTILAGFAQVCTQGKRFVRYLFSDGIIWGEIPCPPAIPEVPRTSPSVMLGDNFTIEFMDSEIHHILLYVANSVGGTASLHFFRHKDKPWVMSPYRMSVGVSAQAGVVYDSTMCLETKGVVLSELGYESWGPPQTEHDQDCVAERCIRRDGDPMPDKQRFVLQLASNFSRWLAYFASQGQLWMKKVPNGSRHPQVKAAYFAGPEPGTA